MYRILRAIITTSLQANSIKYSSTTGKVARQHWNPKSPNTRSMTRKTLLTNSHPRPSRPSSHATCWTRGAWAVVTLKSVKIIALYSKVAESVVMITISLTTRPIPIEHSSSKPQASQPRKTRPTDMRKSIQFSSSSTILKRLRILGGAHQ